MEGSRALAGQDVHSLRNQVAALQADNEALKEELEAVRATAGLATRDREEQDVRYATLEDQHRAVKSRAAAAERTAEELAGRVKELEGQVSLGARRLEESRAVAEELAEQGKEHSQLLAEKREAEVQVEQLRTELQRVVTEEGRKKHAACNELLATRQLLEEIKLEYEQFSETSRLENEVTRRTASEQYNRLKEEYENYRLREMELVQGLLQEQDQVVEALQTQFEEYRRSTEHLFLTEARRLAATVTQQSLQHEEEMYALIRSKDRQFIDMVTAKDAKIMHLIEGTNVQKEIFKHEMELEQRQRQHERELQMVRETAMADGRRLASEAQTRIDELQDDLRHARRDIDSWRSKCEQLTARAAQAARDQSARDASHQREIQSVEARLAAAFAEVERLTQVKENLRHRVLRLRLQMEGEASDSLDSMATRLAKDAERMAGTIEKLSKELAQERERADGASRALEHANQARAHQTAEAERRARETHELVVAFEAALTERVDTLTAAARKYSRKGSVVAATANSGNGAAPPRPRQQRSYSLAVPEATTPQLAAPREGTRAERGRAGSLWLPPKSKHPLRLEVDGGRNSANGTDDDDDDDNDNNDDDGDEDEDQEKEDDHEGDSKNGRARNAESQQGPGYASPNSTGTRSPRLLLERTAAHLRHDSRPVSELRSRLERLNTMSQLGGSFQMTDRSSNHSRGADAADSDLLFGLSDRRARLRAMIKQLRSLPQIDAGTAPARNEKGAGAGEQKAKAKPGAAEAKIKFRPPRSTKPVVTAAALDALDRGFDVLARFEEVTRQHTHAAIALRTRWDGPETTHAEDEEQLQVHRSHVPEVVETVVQAPPASALSEKAAAGAAAHDRTGRLSRGTPSQAASSTATTTPRPKRRPSAPTGPPRSPPSSNSLGLLAVRRYVPAASSAAAAASAASATRSATRGTNTGSGEASPGPWGAGPEQPTASESSHLEQTERAQQPQEEEEFEGKRSDVGPERDYCPVKPPSNASASLSGVEGADALSLQSADPVTEAEPSG